MLCLAKLFTTESPLGIGQLLFAHSSCFVFTVEKGGQMNKEGWNKVELTKFGRSYITLRTYLVVIPCCQEQLGLVKGLDALPWLLLLMMA